MTSSAKPPRRKNHDISIVAEIRGNVIESMMRSGRKVIYEAMASFNRPEDIEFSYGTITVDEYNIAGIPAFWKIEVTGTLHDVEIIEPSPFEVL